MEGRSLSGKLLQNFFSRIGLKKLRMNLINIHNECMRDLLQSVSDSYLNIFISTLRQRVTFIDILGWVMSARLIRIETIIRPGEGRVLELVVEVVEVEGLGDFDECCSMSASWTGPACFPTKCIQILPI